MIQGTGHLERAQQDAGDSGFSMIATLLSLVAVALLTALLLGSTFHSGSASSGTAQNQEVALADSIQAQQSLSTGLHAATDAAAASGDFASVDAATLAAAEPSVTFVSGPSTGPTTVSVATGSTSDGTGDVTLADRSSDGTCWVVWSSPSSPTWYGAQTGQGSCTAPVLSASPVASPVSGSTIGWQQGAFPGA
jgi:type II secretory pathway pseudopilin PulG